MEVERRQITPIEGFSGEMAGYLNGLQDVRKRLRIVAADLTNEELARRAFPEAHQIGNLILHIGEAEASWIHQRIAGKDLDDEQKRRVHWNDTTERDYAEKNYSAEECLARLDEISRRSREILARFSDADLDDIFSFERQGKKIEVSLRWVLIHLIDHESVHRGQISMLKRMLRETR